ncbi:MAG: phosphate starvation-inducible protein PsiF, partial [Burkholderiaceae bacterium]|nr:phosphate starvation-inducible protein PsiF [Burkholderiaceae bacterium]
CNADEKAKTLKGDERKAFMKECLSANKQEKQQTRMKTCNADEKAKTLKGDERKAFMSECLKNK